VPVFLGPVWPTREFCSWALSAKPWRWKWANKASYKLLLSALWAQERAQVNAWRGKALGLAPLRGGVMPLVEGARGAIPVVLMSGYEIVPGQRRPPDYPDYVQVGVGGARARVCGGVGRARGRAARGVCGAVRVGRFGGGKSLQTRTQPCGCAYHPKLAVTPPPTSELRAPRKNNRPAVHGLRLCAARAGGGRRRRGAARLCRRRPAARVPRLWVHARAGPAEACQHGRRGERACPRLIGA
jgi:hypothetical protein